MSAISTEVIEKENRIFILEIHPDFDASDCNPLENSDSGFVSFSSRDEHDSWISKVNLGKAFFVDKYDHSAVHYSVSDTVSYPDQRWDVSHECAVVVPSKDLRANANMVARREKKLFMDVLKESINRELESYSQWCNGEVYGFIVKEVVTRPVKGEEPTVLQEESCWGFLGMDAAESEAKDQLKYMLKPASAFQPGVEEPLVSPKPKF